MQGGAKPGNGKETDGWIGEVMGDGGGWLDGWLGKWVKGWLVGPWVVGWEGVVG